ncbi:MAG: radical SAM protein [Actinobacteria bacterium]|nr:radical SAM protein [Actinomycetota bacterium]MBM3711984.1 radical SAM protein [Actinomycetota bacterium]
MKIFPSKYNYYYKISSEYTIINNFLTGALDIIGSDIWNKVLGNRFDEIEGDPLSALVERGYYYQNLADEDKLFKQLFKNLSKKSKTRPLKFVFCPTFSCNLDCSYCFEKNLPKSRSKPMSDELLESALVAFNEFIENYNKNVNKVELFGGEPLLKSTRQIVERILEFAVSRKLIISIITNGVLAKDFIDILKPINSSIEMLQITLDGPDFIHDKRKKFHSGKGSFQRITESINELVVNGINTNVRINVDVENIVYLPHLYEYVCKMKWLDYPNFKIKPSQVTDHSTLECKYPIIPEEKLLEKLIEIYDEYPHLEDAFGFYMFKPIRHIIELTGGAENVTPRYFNCESNLVEEYVFCPDGYIYTCPESIGNPESAIGEFYPELKFYEEKIKMWSKRDIMTIKECRTCRFSPICGGGCPYSSMLIYRGSLHPICERFQEVLDTFFKYRGKKILKKFIS